MKSKMDDILKRVLNDKNIFSIKKEIFNETEWNELKKSKDNHSDFIQIVESKIESLRNEMEPLENKIKSLENEMNKTSNKNKKNFKRHIESYQKSIELYKKSIELCEGLKSAAKEKPKVLSQMFNVLNSYELVQCNLPSMDDYGKVIERYGLSTVEQFFLDKIKKETDQKKKALAKVLEYVKELYNCNQSALEIAYFVRKLDSLTIFWEVSNE